MSRFHPAPPPNPALGFGAALACVLSVGDWEGVDGYFPQETYSQRAKYSFVHNILSQDFHTPLQTAPYRYQGVQLGINQANTEV